MIAPGAPKDNENPTIHAVEEDNNAHARKNRPLGWSQLQSLHALDLDEEKKDDSNNMSSPFLRTSGDRAVVHAILDSLEASQGEGVSILRKAGVALPKYSNDSPSFPQDSAVPRLIPSSYLEETKRSRVAEMEKLKGSRDAITPDEIFTIIRNIQDPEHAGVTLEQLRVVSRGQIEVQEGETPKGDVNVYTNANESVPLLSSVTVRFT